MMPLLLNSDVSELEISLFFLPARIIRDPIELCHVDFGSFLVGVAAVFAAIDGTTEFD